MSITPQDLVFRAREIEPYKYQDFSDIEIYKDLQKRYPNKEFPDFHPIKITKDSLMEAEASPNFLEWLGTVSLAETGVDEGAFGGSISPEFFKDSYNKSMPGLVYQSIHGEPKYKVEDYDPSFAAQAGQFALGLLSPLELATFALSGGVGKVATSASSRLLAKGLTSSLSKKAAATAAMPKGKIFLNNIVNSAVEMGVSGGAFSAAHGAVHSTAEQKKDLGAIDMSRTFKDASSSFLQSLPLYMATGGVAGGVMKTLHGFSSLPEFTNKAFGQKVNKLLTGTVPQVGVEAAMFSTLPAVMDMEGAASFGSDEWLSEFGKNTLIIGGLRGFNVVWNGKKGDVDATQILKTELKLRGKEASKKTESLNSVINDLPANIPKQEVLREVLNSELLSQNASKDIKLNEKTASKLKEVLKKTDDPKYLEKLKKGDVDIASDIDFILKEGNAVSLKTRGAVEEIISNPSKLEEHYKVQFPKKEMTPQKLNLFKESLKNMANNIDDSFEQMNIAARGNIKTKEGYVPIEKPKETEGYYADGKFHKTVRIKEQTDAYLLEGLSLNKLDKKLVSLTIDQIIKDNPGLKGKELQNKVRENLMQLESNLTTSNKNFSNPDFESIDRIVQYRTGEVKEPVKPKVVSKPLPKETTKTIERTESSVEGAFQNLYKKIGAEAKSKVTEKKLIKEHIYELAGVDKGYDFKVEIDPTVAATNMRNIFSTLKNIDPNIIKRIPETKTFFATYARISKPNGLKERANITDVKQKEILTTLGVKDGNIANAKTKQLQSYESMLYEIQPAKDAPSAWLDFEIKSGLVAAQKRKDINNWLGLKKAIMPTDVVLESIGAKSLANKMRTHVGAELNHKGKLFDFEHYSRNIKGIGKKKFNKYKDYITSLDKDRYLERLKENTLSKGEKDFINKAMNIKSWKPKNTPEGKFVKEYVKFTEYWPKELGKILKLVTNEATYERIKPHLKFVKDNIYVTRKITNEFKDIYLEGGRLVESILDKIARPIAKDMAIKKHKTSSPSKKQIQEFMEQATMLAEAEMHNMFEFNPGNFSSSFMKARKSKLPEYITLSNGKKVKVYETSYDKTVGAYADGMAKLLANLEFFPEYVTLQGFKFPGRKTNITELSKIDRNLAKFADKMVKNHLGIEKPATEYKVAATRLQQFTATLAKLQLSFPTSGLKNLLMGSTQTMLAFKERHFFSGMFSAISADNRRMVRSMSAHELGMKHFDPKGFGIIPNIVFKFGLMKPTEHINRYISVLASIRDQAELARILKYSTVTSRKYKKAYDRLEGFYKLDSKEIALIKKYGTRPEQINVSEFKNSVEAGRVVRNLENVMKKMTTLAHINTQGASIDLFMPEWASNPLLKSGLLYKRMAYAATVNSLRNMKVATKTGSPMALAFFGLGTYLSGETMIYVYDKLLGQTMPTENSPRWKQFLTTLWKGEFMGLASEFFSPYFGKENMNFSTKTAIASSMQLLWSTLSNSWTDKKFWLEGNPNTIIGQQWSELLAGHVGLYNGVNKIFERATNSYNKNSMRFSKLHKEYSKEMSKNKLYQPNTELFAQFEKSKYMSAFDKMFRAGNEKEFAKWYVLALFQKANDYYSEGRLPNMKPIRNEREAFKEASKQMELALDKLNPVREIFDPKTGKIDISGKRQYNFYRWLAEKEYKEIKKANPSYSEKRLWDMAFKKSDKVKDLTKIRDEYGYKVRSFKKNFNTYYKEMNVDSLLKEFGIKKVL